VPRPARRSPQGAAPGVEAVKVLLVEDDASIAAPLLRGLEREGFAVDHCGTGAALLERLDAGSLADVVLLDLGLPDADGFDLCRRVRGASDVPIVVVTARGEEIDRVLGLELGADDYVVKPFGFRELVARIRAVTRRRAADAQPQVAAASGQRLLVDDRTHRVTLDGGEIALTHKEFDLLAFLARDPGAVCTREHIIDEVWDPHWYGPTKTLDVHVASIRRKLGDAGWIETVRGVGFRLGDVAPAGTGAA
jgi:two-component system response regulator RegX3